MRVWNGKELLHMVQQTVILSMLAMLGAALEPALKVVCWRTFGELFLIIRLGRALRAVGISDNVASIADTIIYTGPTLAICLALYALLGHRYCKEPGVTRCRRCRHILQKLSEARCPECGETI